MLDSSDLLVPTMAFHRRYRLIAYGLWHYFQLYQCSTMVMDRVGVLKPLQIFMNNFQ